MATRSKEQILDEVIYAINCVSYHYGPCFNQEGLKDLREKLKDIDFWADAEYMGRYEDEDFIDFHERIIWPENWVKINIKEIKDKIHD